MNMSPAFLAPRRAASLPADVSRFPAWARMAYEDLVLASRTVGAGPLLDEFAELYLMLDGFEECCWPARAYWREMAAFMGEARRRRLALARLWPEFLRFRQGRRSPGCTEVRKILLSGGRPHGLDCLHAARCEHCRMFVLYLTGESAEHPR